MILIVIGVAWNVFVSLCYAYDKRQAIKGHWRVSERFLLTITLLFGGFGALVGARRCHHKTQKWYFRWSWYLGILATIALMSAYIFAMNIL